MTTRYTALVDGPVTEDAPAGTASLRTLGTGNPQALGVPAPGTATSASASDHVHAMPSSSDVGAVPTSRTLSTTSPLSGGGDLTSNRTLSLTLAAGSGLEDSTGLRISTSAAGTGLTGGGGSALSVSFGNTNVTACVGNDSRLSDPRTPTSHANTHGVLGGDPVSIASTQVSGLGGAATLNVGAVAGTVAAGDDSRITGAAQKASNLSDLANAGTSRTNLGVQDGPRLIPLFALANSSSAVTSVVGYAGFTPAAYAISGRTAVLTLDVIGQVSGGGLTGTIEVLDSANITVATLSWTETSATRKTAAIALPAAAEIYRARVSCTGVVDPITEYALLGGANISVTWS